MTKVTMIAKREFPLGEKGEGGRRLVQPGEEYEVNSTEVAFHEDTGRGKKKAEGEKK